MANQEGGHAHSDKTPRAMLGPNAANPNELHGGPRQTGSKDGPAAKRRRTCAAPTRCPAPGNDTNGTGQNHFRTDTGFHNKNKTMPTGHKIAHALCEAPTRQNTTQRHNENSNGERLREPEWPLRERPASGRSTLAGSAACTTHTQERCKMFPNLLTSAEQRISERTANHRIDASPAINGDTERSSRRGGKTHST